MNNFSISTDELATALQNAAAVLSTQGVDLYKATALITAGKIIARIYRNVYIRTYLIAGKTLEPYTTII